MQNQTRQKLDENVSNNSLSISCMQVLTKQSFSGSEQHNRHSICATKRKALQDQGHLQPLQCRKDGAGRGNLCVPACSGTSTAAVG